VSPPRAPGWSSLTDVGALLATRDLELLRAWPRDENHLLIEAGRGGSPVAGQWFSSAARAAAVAAKTRGAEQVGRVVLQPRGADRRLPGLMPLLRRRGAELVAHRPEKRAVVRLAPSFPGAGPAEYAKVVRPDALGKLAQTAATAAALPVRTPAVVRTEPDVGSVVTTALPGRTLYELLATPAAIDGCRAAGRALAAVHRAAVPPGARRHDDEDERAVLCRWSQLAQLHGVTPAFDVPEIDPADEGHSDSAKLALVHRDFHDKQVVVDEDGDVGVLDFDLLAAGPPMVDLANLLVHLDLRALQGLVADAAPLRTAVLEGYQPSGGQLRQLPRRERSTWQRLAAVYAFRPAGTAT